MEISLRNSGDSRPFELRSQLSRSSRKTWAFWNRKDGTAPTTEPSTDAALT